MDAEPLYRRTLEIRQTALGADHPEQVITLDEYAALLRTTGQTAQGG